MKADATRSVGIAIFDLDYTLTKRGTWGRFVWLNVRFKPYLWLPLILSAAITQLRYKLGHIPRIEVKKSMMAWSMRRKPRAEMTRLARHFADKEIETGLRPGAVKALQFHADKGDVIMIASAAVDILVAEIAKRLDIDHFVATDMAWDEEDRLKPDFSSRNCYSSEKLSRVCEYFQKHSDLKQNNTKITMYSDSHSDLDILRYADVGVAVNPDAKLKILSKTHGFRVEDWMRLSDK